VMGLPPVAPYLADGKLRGLAVSSPTRSQAFPDIPTLGESGIPDQESELQIGVVAPAGTPATVVSALQREIAEITALPEVKNLLDTVSFHVVASAPAAFEKQIKDDIATWSKVMKEANIPVN